MTRRQRKRQKQAARFTRRRRVISPEMTALLDDIAEASWEALMTGVAHIGPMTVDFR